MKKLLMALALLLLTGLVFVPVEARAQYGNWPEWYTPAGCCLYSILVPMVLWDKLTKTPYEKQGEMRTIDGVKYSFKRRIGSSRDYRRDYEPGCPFDFDSKYYFPEESFKGLLAKSATVIHPGAKYKFSSGSEIIFYGSGRVFEAESDNTAKVELVCGRVSFRSGRRIRFYPSRTVLTGVPDENTMLRVGDRKICFLGDTYSKSEKKKYFGSDEKEVPYNPLSLRFHETGELEEGRLCSDLEYSIGKIRIILQEKSLVRFYQGGVFAGGTLKEPTELVIGGKKVKVTNEIAVYPDGAVKKVRLNEELSFPYQGQILSFSKGVFLYLSPSGGLTGFKSSLPVKGKFMVAGKRAACAVSEICFFDNGSVRAMHPSEDIVLSLITPVLSISVLNTNYVTFHDNGNLKYMALTKDTPVIVSGKKIVLSKERSLSFHEDGSLYSGRLAEDVEFHQSEPFAMRLRYNRSDVCKPCILKKGKDIIFASISKKYDRNIPRKTFTCPRRP